MEVLKNILFIDIETVPILPDFNQLPEWMQDEWARKAKFLKSSTEGNMDAALIFSEKAGIFSEFAKIVCISFGNISTDENGTQMRLKSLVNDNEKILLNEFCQVIGKFVRAYKEVRFCGHNIKEFDIPFICRRMVINELNLPDCLQVSGKKPWEVNHIDTMELWRFGDHKNFTALSLLAQVLGIPSPKGDIDGSMVGDVYWKDKDLERIGKYCVQDVLTVAKVYLRLKGNSTAELNPVYVKD